MNCQSKLTLLDCKNRTTSDVLMQPIFSQKHHASGVDSVAAVKIAATGELLLSVSTSEHLSSLLSMLNMCM